MNIAKNSSFLKAFENIYVAKNGEVKPVKIDKVFEEEKVKEEIIEEEEV